MGQEVCLLVLVKSNHVLIEVLMRMVDFQLLDALIVIQLAKLSSLRYVRYLLQFRKQDQ